MAYTALYRKWRPARFEDVRGQEHIVRTLKNQIISDRVGHAYLFCGTRGTGKTTIVHAVIKMYLKLNGDNSSLATSIALLAPTGRAAKRLSESTNMEASTIHRFLGYTGDNHFAYNKYNKTSSRLIIVDEAHRLTEKSDFYGHGENQIKEIINSSNFSMFFLDENQRVTLKDIGKEETIKKFAKQLNAGVYTYELNSQFRCNGSDGYIAWLDNILEIRETANFDIDGFDYEFKVFDDPNELRNAIEDKNKINNKSRIVAGYCWEWPKINRTNPNYNDIIIPEYNFEMSWNLDGSEIFALGKNTVKQAGCIHTTQGLEFDYVGVIIGNDLRYENDHIITDHTKRAKTDSSLKGLNLYPKEEQYEIADEIIKNTYRTLMTRGMKGCYIYCTDKNLQNYFKERLNKE